MTQKHPIYISAAQVLREDIENGVYPEGSILPSERVLSEKLGISRITLRKAVDELVCSGQVAKQYGRGTMVVDSINSTNDVLSSPDMSKSIVFVLCSDNGRDRFSETYQASLFYIMERQCAKLGYHLIYKTFNQGEQLKDILFGLDASFLILSSSIGPDILDQVIKEKIPSVVVNYCDHRFISVQNDDASGSSQMVQYLIDEGHKRIGALSGPKDYLTSELRLSAWRNTLRNNGMNPEEMFVSYGNWEFESGLEAAFQIADLPVEKRPDAVFAFNDKSAAGLIRGLESCNISVPDDISVVGFDDMPICTEISPKLTTIQVNLNAIAFAITQQIWYAHNDSNIEPYPYNIVVPCKCIFRESVKKRN